MPDTNEDLKRTIIALLLKLQLSDEKSDLREFAYIHKVATHLGMNADEVRQIESSIDRYPLKPPADEKERMTILYYLLFLMEIDDEVTEEEEDLVKEFGTRLGFRTGLTSDLIRVVKKYSDSRIPPDAMLGEIKKYLN